MFLNANDRTRSVGAKLTTTNPTAVYTVPTGMVMAKGLTMKLCNVDGSSAVDVTIEWFDDSENTSYKMASTLSVAADDYHDFDLLGIALDPDDEIRVTAGAANDLEVVTTVTETGGR